jgi:ParB family transcriptional regulator, chromosome partitioning protein
MKARMDMGEALRNTTLVSRPSDMFFLPSTSTPDGGDSSALAEGPQASAETTPDSREHVSRETPVPELPTEVQETTSDGREAVSRETSDADGVADPSADPTAPGDGQQGSTAEPGEKADDVLSDVTTSAATVARERDVSRETETGAEELAAVPGATFAEIPVASIHPNRKQPRQVFDEEELAELAYSIGELGVLQPIVVRPTREDGEQSYELVMGERRWRATQRAGLPTIPAIVRETADDDLLRDALLENLHRSQLNPLEEAAAYQQLLEEFGTTQEELSRRIGRSRPQISNTIRLLRLPPLVQRRVAAGVLSSGHARALLSLADPAAMERLAQRIVAEGLSVRATEEAVQLSEAGERKPQRAAAPAGRNKERLDYIAEAFSDRLDTSVRIALGARKGKMTIEFASVEDLNRIIEVLDPGMDRS